MSDSYRALLRRPSVRPLIGALCAAWLSFGMVGLAVILAVHRATGSFGAAGVVMASFSIGASALAPVRGRVIDRRGMRPWLLVFAAGYGSALTALAFLASPGAATWPLIGCAAIAGLSAPPLIATLRGLWSSTVGESELRRAYALTSLVGDVGMVAAPALCGFLFVLAPWSPLVVCALTPLVGAGIVVRRSLSPPAGGDADVSARSTPFTSSAMRALLVVSVALGSALGFVEVAVPAAATEWELVRYSGLLLASFAMGSVVGGLWFGRRHWRRQAQERYLIAAVLLALTLAPLALAWNAGALAALLFVAGLSFGPATISLFEALDVVAPPGSTEALTWVTTAESAGIAVGAALSGWLIATFGVRSPFVAASAILGATAMGALAVARSRKSD